MGVDDPEGKGWIQEEDTLDTWFSSGLWTFSTLGYPDMNASDLRTYHPTTMMETGYDILFFWVARMVLMTTYALGEIPFRNVYLHGLIRDEQGRKMSKSLGNVIDPLDMIAKYGTDATRLALLLGNSPGNDVRLSEEKIAGFRNFTNKLWNISRFILLNIENPEKDCAKPEPESWSGNWIMQRLEQTILSVNAGIKAMNFSLAGEILRDFTWGDLADWYLEAAKIESSVGADKESGSAVLNYVLNAILKLWHPFMPFVTEQIWQEVYGAGEILMVEKVPYNACAGCYGDGAGFDLVKSIITRIRSLRADYKIEPAKKINAVIGAGDEYELFAENAEIIKKLARLNELTVSPLAEKPENAIAFAESGVDVYVVLSGAVDLEKERHRLSAEAGQTAKYLSGLQAKLGNAEFVKNAPKEVVEKEKQKLADGQEKLKKIQEQLSMLE